MGGFFGAALKTDCVFDLFFGTDYHSHLGTRRAGMAVYSKEKGYDKWVDLAACVWDLVCESYTYRDDLTIVFTAHTQTDHDENGYMFTRIKTSGKKLDKIVLESKFTTVLLSKCVDGDYKLETQANNSTAKSPMGAFDQMEIDNDIVEVIKALEEF